MTTHSQLIELANRPAEAERLLAILQCPPDARGADQAMLIGALALELIADPTVGARAAQAKLAETLRDTAYAVRRALHDDHALMAAVAMPASKAGRTRARGYCAHYPVWAVCMHTDTPQSDDASPVIALIALMVAAVIKTRDQHDEHHDFFVRIGRYLRAMDDGLYDAWIPPSPDGFDDSTMWQRWLQEAGRGAIRNSAQWRVLNELAQLVRLAFYGERRRVQNNNSAAPVHPIPASQYGWLHTQSDGPPRRAWTGSSGEGGCGAIVRSPGDRKRRSVGAGDTPGGDHPETGAVVYRARQNCALDSPYYSVAEAAIASRHQAEAIKRYNNVTHSAPLALSAIDIVELLGYIGNQWQTAPVEDRAAMCLAELMLWTGREVADLAFLPWRTRGVGLDRRRGVVVLAAPNAAAYLSTLASEAVRKTAAMLDLAMPAPTRGRLIALGRTATPGAPLWAGTPDTARAAIDRILAAAGLAEQGIGIMRLSRVCGPAVARACAGDWCAAAQITGRVPPHARSQIYYTHISHDSLLKTWRRAIDGLLGGVYREAPDLEGDSPRWLEKEQSASWGFGSRVTPTEAAVEAAVAGSLERRHAAAHAAFKTRHISQFNAAVDEVHLALLLGVGARGVREPVAFAAQWDGYDKLLLAEKAGDDWGGARVVLLPEWVVQSLRVLQDHRERLGFVFPDPLAGLARLLVKPYTPGRGVSRSRAMGHPDRLPWLVELDHAQFGIASRRDPIRARVQLFYVPSVQRLRTKLLPAGLPLNAGRHGIRSGLVAARVGASAIDAYLGHAVLGTSPMDGASSSAPLALADHARAASEQFGHGCEVATRG